MNKKARNIIFIMFKILVSAGLIYFIISHVDWNDKVLISADGKLLSGEILDAPDDPDNYHIKPPGDAEIIIVPRDSAYWAEVVEKTGESISVLDKDGKTLTFDFVKSSEKRKTYRYGFLTYLRIMNLQIAIPAFLMHLMTVWIGVVRWRALLSAHGLSIPFMQALRLTYVGFFFNNFMMGSTGGDVIKAYYVAKQSPPEHKAEAVVSVFMDRLVGIFGLAVLSAFCIMTKITDERFRLAVQIIAVFITASIAVIILYYSNFIRSRLKLGKLADKLPFGALIRRVAKAVDVYKDKKKILFYTLFLSILAHMISVIMNFLFARSLGADDVMLIDFLILLPVVYMFGAIPASVAGLGVTEGAYAYFFSTLTGIMEWTQITAVSLLNRLTWTIHSLVGGVVWAFSGKVSKNELEKTVEQSIIDDEEVNTDGR